MNGWRWFLGLSFTTIVITTFLVGCSEEDPSTIGFSNNEGKYKTVYLDSFSVKVSTVLFDSIRTSGTGRILAGSYPDNKLGRVTASSYFSVVPSTWSMDDFALYDSMLLVLYYDGYYFGDTLSTHEFEVHQLSEALTGRSSKDRYLYDDIPYSLFYAEGSLYNSSRVANYNTVIGKKKFNPKPSINDSLQIRLDNDMGREWFELKRVNDDRLTADESFIEFFKGMKITSTSADAVIGFNSASAKIRIYYKEVSGSGLYEQKYHDFPIYNSSLQYNEILTDRSGSSLAGIIPYQPKVSTLVNNEAFLQAGTGMMVKVEFPHLNKIFESVSNVIITQAQLEISPLTDNQFTIDDLPDSLALFYTNQTNVPINTLASEIDSTEPQVARLFTNSEYEQEAGYTFSITSYISNILKKPESTVNPLLLGMPSADFLKEVTRARIAGGSQPSIKLKIYYTTYN